MVLVIANLPDSTRAPKAKARVPLLQPNRKPRLRKPSERLRLREKASAVSRDIKLGKKPLNAPAENRPQFHNLLPWHEASHMHMFRRLQELLRSEMMSSRPLPSLGLFRKGPGLRQTRMAMLGNRTILRVTSS